MNSLIKNVTIIIKKELIVQDLLLKVKIHNKIKLIIKHLKQNLKKVQDVCYIVKQLDLHQVNMINNVYNKTKQLKKHLKSERYQKYHRLHLLKKKIYQN